MLPNNSQVNRQSIQDEDGISISEIFYVLRKHQKMIFLLTLLVFLSTFFYTSFQKSIYSSKGLIMINDPYESMAMFEMTSDKNYLSNEIEILRSRTIAEKTIERLLESEHKNNLFLFGTRQYEYSWIEKIPGFNLFSPEKKPFQINGKVSDARYHHFVNKFRNSLQIRSIKRTDMLSISLKSNDADEAALLINTLIEVYSSMDLEWARGEMTHLESFLSEQISKKEVQLADSEKKLQQFQKQEQIFGIDENSNLLLGNLMDAESEFYQVKAEKNIIHERMDYIQGQLTQEEKNLTQRVSNSIDNRLFAIKNEIALKESELITAISQQGEEHQIVRNLRDKIDGLKKNIKNETRSLIAQGISVADPIKFRQSLMDSVISLTARVAMLDTKADEFKKLVDRYQGQLGSLPEQMLEYTRLSRNLKIYADTYSLMRQKLEEVRINQASQIGKVRVVDEALPNYRRISPDNKKNMIMGLLFGLMLSLGIAFQREFFDRTIKSVSELDKRHLSILALIPAIGRRNGPRYKTKKYQMKIGNGNAETIQRRLITHEDPKSPVSEAYRGLRTSLLYSKSFTKDEQGNVILISSAGPGEGKTTTIVNLAITYANLGLKTILLDTDLRKPVAHKVFSVNRDPGITKLLSGFEEDYSKLIQSTEVDKLDIITCGVIPPNPSEILESVHMSNLIKKLRQDYDVILMDAPPLLAVTDAFVCMKYTDQFILVVRSGVTEKAGLDRALSQIQHTDTKLSGVVVNAIDESNSYSGYYYNYYQYYYGDEK